MWRLVLPRLSRPPGPVPATIPGMSLWLLLVLLVLATYSVTRLVTADAFPPVLVAREWVQDRAGPDSALAYLVTCPWCVGVYVSAGLVGAVLWAGYSLPLPLLWVAALRVCAGILAQALGD